MELKYVVWITNAKYQLDPRNYNYAIERDGLDMSSEGWVAATQGTVTFEPPSKDQVVQDLVAGLRKQKMEVMETAQKKMNEIEDHLKKLLALTHEV